MLVQGAKQCAVRGYHHFFVLRLPTSQGEKAQAHHAFEGVLIHVLSYYEGLVTPTSKFTEVAGAVLVKDTMVFFFVRKRASECAQSD